MLSGVLRVLRTRIAWEDLLQEYGLGSEVLRGVGFGTDRPLARAICCTGACSTSSMSSARSTGPESRLTARMFVPFWGPDGPLAR